MRHRRVVVWLLEPPKAEKGAYNYLTRHWGADVIYVFYNALPEYRKQTAWGDGGFGDAKILELGCCPNKENEVKKICEEYSGDIHIVTGFTNEFSPLVKKHINHKTAIMGIFTERPTFMGSVCERLLRHCYSFVRYSHFRLLYDKYTSFVLPTGLKAMNNYRHYGWKESKLFNFMYNPDIPDRYVSKTLNENDEVRFVFIGRFYNKTKGVVDLVEASKRLKGKFQVCLVGGYGQDSETIIKECEKIDKVNFIGSWKADEVVRNLSEYDVAVVPSRYDGWNLLANESIHAGIGCIISNEAVSQEVIMAANSGEVFDYSNVKELATIMQRVINDHEIVNTWKKNASAFVDRISEETVGLYLIDILNYVCGYSQKKPKCPWVK